MILILAINSQVISAILIIHAFTFLILFTIPARSQETHLHIHNSRKESADSPAFQFPRQFPKEFPAYGQDFLGPKFARPPAGKKTRRPSAGAVWS